MFTPRPYQHDAVRGIWQYYITGGRGHPVVAMPTGTGKSAVISMFCQSVIENYADQFILNLTHVKELIEQNSQQLTNFIDPEEIGVYSAGLRRRDVGRVTVAGIQSVAKRARLFQNTSLVLIDECHLVSPNGSTQYRQFIGELMAFNPQLKVIGFTATPYRLGHGSLVDGHLFTDICVNQTTPEWFEYFINNNWMSPLIPRRTQNQIDTTGIRMRGGEFMASDVEETMTTRAIVGALSETLDHARDRKKWMVFVSSVETAKLAVEILRSMGVSACAVHSKMAQDGHDRDEVIAAFKRGEYRALVNVNMLTTGFDDRSVDLIVMLRPTQSPALWVQMLGRGTRVADGKENCLVLDFVGNTERLGPIDDPVLPKKPGNGDPPTRMCPECDTMNRAAARVCIYCGHTFPPPEEKNPFEAAASSLALISSHDMPVVEVFAVDQMIAELHRSRKSEKDIMKVSYFSRGRRFTEFVCFNHTGYARKKAETWWKEHAYTDVHMAADPPDNVAEALQYFDQVHKPTHIRVQTNLKYPDIKAYDFTGTAFGTGLVDQADEIPF